MAFHHVAVATHDLATTHRFYTEACGFELVKVVAAPTPDGDGWARHVFYETGGGEMFAVWDIHSTKLPADWSTAISTGLGLPEWVNHIAFNAPDLDALAAARDRWVAHGYDVAEIDHGWCTSVYANDPNGIMVEFCTTTAEFTAADREEAARLLAADRPELDRTPMPIQFFTGAVSVS